MKDHSLAATIAMILLGATLACLLAAAFLLWRAMQMVSAPVCPPMLIYEDINGNRQQDSGETGLTNDELEDVYVEFFTDQDEYLGKASYLGCFMPTNAKGKISVVIHLPPELRPTSPLRYTMDAIYAMDTYLPIGVQKR